MRLLPIVLLLTLHGHAAADPPLADYDEDVETAEEALDPVAKITGPETGRPGQIVILDATGSELAEGFAWHVETTAKAPDDTLPPEGQRWADTLKANGWQEPEGEKEPLWLISDDGQKVLLASYPGTYHVTLAVGNTVTAVPSMAHHTFVSSTPDAPPPPDDSPPDYDFSGEVPGWLNRVPAENRTDGSDLSEACLSMNDPRWTDRDLVDTKFGVAAALAVGNTEESIAAWRPFFDAMNNSLNTIPESATLAQYKQAYVSIGKGLKN